MATVEIRCKGYAGRKDHRVTPPVRPIRDGEVVVAEPGIAVAPRRDSVNAWRRASPLRATENGR
jgi:hypothetical protein